MQIKKKLLMLLIFLAGGCVPKHDIATYQSKLSAWIGKSEYQLYAEWGYPKVTYSVGPDTFIVTYIKSYNEPVDGNTEPYTDEVYYPAAAQTPAYGLPVPQGVYYCKTSFVIKNGFVDDFNFNGDDCVR